MMDTAGSNNHHPSEGGEQQKEVECDNNKRRTPDDETVGPDPANVSAPKLLGKALVEEEEESLSFHDSNKIQLNEDSSPINDDNDDDDDDDDLVLALPTTTTTHDAEDAAEEDAPGEETLAAEKQVLEPIVPKKKIKKSNKKENSVNNNDKGDGSCNILTLPMDSLHHIASFLTPCEWLQFAQTSKTANAGFKEIIRRVRLHGFKCASEVITAWKLGHHSDAKELVALYIQSGVPIYPRSLGHSYHTLLWRMQVESREIMMPQQSTSENKIDPFYWDRIDFRAEEEYSPELTYVEEKCLYWTAQTVGLNKPRSPPRNSSTGTTSTRRLLIRQSSNETAASSRPVSPIYSDTESVVTERIPVRVHQHLVDQHVRRKFCVNDNDGLMISPGFSLSADFYHPNHVLDTEGTTVDLQSIPETMEPTPSQDEDEPAAEPVQQPAAAAALNAIDALNAVDGADELLIAQESTLSERRLPPSPAKLVEALQTCEVETYTASHETSTTVDLDGSHELRKHLKSRFSTYQRRLETFLVHMDNSSLEECILDFWDEFFPHTAYIQYYDLHTAVPRVSCLQKFLTRPCPKAIGIVQCEIERIKITSRGKGVSMKGRLFPTYEYRLFIRHRPHNQAPESALDNQEDEGFDRRDTVLMVAKNRGRKHTEIAGVGPTKKGSNNYYLYMPQQMDVDAHYNKVNRTPSKINANGASLDPVIVSEDSSSVLMGRLQSNFIGTEFQIFTPRQKKQTRRKGEPQVAKTVYSPSDDEVDYDSSYSSDTTSTRRSRMGRFRLGSTTLAASESSTESSAPRARARSVPRSVSSSDGRRPNRRAIANAEGTSTQTSISEEEDGVITYTANLLGSRPRIMDVCIPRVGLDGVTGAEWRRYLDGMEEPEEGRMLACFRQLLQRLENLDPQQPRLDGGDGAQEPHHGDDDETNPVAGTSGDDFGLVPLQNRPPWWNVELGSFVLNFGGRVSVASVKNFQLCDRNDQDNIMLQFGRIQGRHSFTMDFQYPLTAVQAFSIAISSLQSKISFG